MKINRIGLVFLDEALQQAQLDKAVKVLSELSGESPEETREKILTSVSRVDPTVKDNPMKGKYAGWLVRILVDTAKDVKQAKWIAENPEKAHAQGLLKNQLQLAGYREPEIADLTPSEIEHYAQQTSEAIMSAAQYKAWAGNPQVEEKLHGLLARFHEMSRRGWLDRLGVEKNINAYDTWSALEHVIGEAGGPIEFVIENPGNLDFFTAYQDAENDVYILGTENTETALKLGACAGWCFGTTQSYAEEYTSAGPLYFLFVGKDADLPGGLKASPSDVFLDMDAVAAISPYSSTIPEGEPPEPRTALEIRDATNNWITPYDLSRANPDLLKPVVSVVEKQRQADVDSAWGFEQWLETGEVREDPIPEDARDFLEAHDLDLDPDGDIVIPIDTTTLTGRANLAWWDDGGVPTTENRGTSYVFVDPQDFYRWSQPAYATAAEEVIEPRYYDKLVKEIIDDAWRRGSLPERLAEEILEEVPEDGAGNASKSLWVKTFAEHGINSSDIESFFDSSDLFIVDEDGEVDVYSPIIRRFFSDPDSAKVNAFRKALGIPSDRKLALDREVAMGQQFFPFAPPAEFKVESKRKSNDTRAVIRKTLLGREN
ncbi:MAG: hypothetical protein GF311_27625 [Candidatus Lokiarchaeota archaeon]|nr:hypothetical protein [Candidatus Lokiarchaeota archaeon]